MIFWAKFDTIAPLWRKDDRASLRAGEESPGSRKQGVRRKAEIHSGRNVASQSHRNYVDFSTLKVGKNE